MLRGLLIDCFGTSALADYDPDDRVLVEIGGRPIAHVGLIDRTIKINGTETKVLGIGFVCTAPEFRGQGLMTALMRVAHAASGLDYALPWTGIPEAYEPLGYKSQPNLPELWMVAELSGKSWPQDVVVDLGGTW